LEIKSQRSGVRGREPVFRIGVRVGRWSLESEVGIQSAGLRSRGSGLESGSGLGSGLNLGKHNQTDPYDEIKHLHMMQFLPLWDEFFLH
jgi:hypothetical protein